MTGLARRFLRSTRWMLMLAVVLAAVVGRAAPAAAQGTENLLPDPISSAELTRYMNRLKLLEPQRQAAATFLDQYKGQFKQLRDNEIEKFMESMRKMQGSSMGGMPKRAELEALLKDRDRLMTRIQALDDAFFGSLQPLLTEEQMSLLPRARMARERERHKAQQMMPFMGGANVDLSTIIEDLELTSEERAAVDSVLVGYEARLTRSAKGLYQATTEMWLDIFKALEERGFGNQDDFSNPETAKAAMEAMQQIWAEVTKKMQATAGEISDLNKQTYRGLASLLAKKPARQLRNRFYQRAYPQAFWNMQGDQMFERALKINDLTGEQRAGIEAARDQYEAASDRVVDEMIELIEKFQADFSIFDGGGAWQAQEEKMSEKRVKLTEQLAAATTSLAGILGPERAAKLNEPAQKAARTMVPAAGDEASGGEADAPKDAAGDAQEAEAAAVAAMGMDDQGPDEFLPNPISAKEIKAYARRLGLDESNEAIIKEMLREYSTRYGAIRDTQIKAVQEAQGQLWSHGSDSNQSPAQKVEQLAKARSAAIAAIRALDEWFFNEVGDVVLTGDTQAQMLQRIRLSRQRVATNRGGSMMGYSYFGGSRETTIDLVRLLEKQQLDEAGWKAVDAVLAEYEKPVTDAMQARFQLAVESDKAMQELQLRMREREDAGDIAEVNLDYQKVWQDNGRRLSEAGRAITTLNRQTLPKLLAALPSDAAGSLRHAYNTRAYPSVYSDPQSAEPKINAALKLPGLSDEQRSQVEDISKTFRAAYNTLSEQMVENSPANDGWVDFQSEDAMKDWQKKHSKLETLRYERNETSFKAVTQLRSVLTPEQVAAIGGLEDPKKPEQRWYGIEE